MLSSIIELVPGAVATNQGLRMWKKCNKSTIEGGRANKKSSLCDECRWREKRVPDRRWPIPAGFNGAGSETAFAAGHRPQHHSSVLRSKPDFGRGDGGPFRIQDLPGHLLGGRVGGKADEGQGKNPESWKETTHRAPRVHCGYPLFLLRRRFEVPSTTIRLNPASGIILCPPQDNTRLFLDHPPQTL